jgi:XrtJ-associated TM-motif-TM protein
MAGRAKHSPTPVKVARTDGASLAFHCITGARRKKYSAASARSRLSRRTTVKKLAYIVPAAILLFATALPAFATGGCTDSPENPTVVLGLVVSAASIGFVQFRNRFGNRKKQDNKK